MKKFHSIDEHYMSATCNVSQFKWSSTTSAVIWYLLLITNYIK